MDEIIRRLYPGAYQDEESGIWFFDDPQSGERTRIDTENIDPGIEAEKFAIQAANAIGLVPLSSLNGIEKDPSIFQRSAEAQRRGLYDLNSYLAYQYGPGQIVDTPNGPAYKGTATTQQNPFDFGLASPDPVGDMVLAGIVTAMTAGIAGPALSGLGSVGQGAAVGAISGGANAGLSGGDIGRGILNGGLVGAVGGGITSQLGGANGMLANAGIVDKPLQNAIIGGTKGLAGALITGGDPLLSAASSAAGAYASTALSSLAPSMTYEASGDAFQPGDMNVSSTPATSDGLPLYEGAFTPAPPGSPLAQNNWAGADSITGGGPITPAPQAWIDGLNNPFSYLQFPQQMSQPTKEAAGGKNVAFFDDILGDPNAPDNYDLTGDTSVLGLDNWGDWLPTDGTGPTGDVGTVFGEPGFDMSPYIGDASGLFGAAGSALAKFLLGGGSTSDQIRRLLGGTAKGQDGGLLGDLFGERGLAATTAAIAPSLAAINYAKNQSPFDTSGLQGLSSQIPTSYNFDTSGVQSLQSQVPNFNVDTFPLTSLQSQVPTAFNVDTSGVRNVANQIPGNFSVDTSRLSNINVPTSFNFDTSGVRDVMNRVPGSYNFDTSGVQNVMNQVPGSYNFDTSKLNDAYNRVPTNQTFDTSKLNDAYRAFDPNSVTGQYDLNTAAARQGLASSLAARGVAGSSFANSDFANFGQQRDVGRQQLINDAITRRAGIANDILSNDRAAAGLNLQGIGLQGQLASNMLDNQRSQAALGLQGLGLKGQLANNLLGAQQNQAQLGLQGLGIKGNLAGQLLDTQKSQAALGLQGQGLQSQIANQLINAQQTANSQNLQGLGLRGQLESGLLDSQYKNASLGLQGLGLKGQFANQAINAQQQNNAQNLQGLGLRNQMAQSLLDNQYRSSALGLQGQGLQRNILGDVLNAQIASQKNKNDLYGRALLALSGGLTPKSAGIF